VWFRIERPCSNTYAERFNTGIPCSNTLHMRKGRNLPKQINIQEYLVQNTCTNYQWCGDHGRRDRPIQPGPWRRMLSAADRKKSILFCESLFFPPWTLKPGKQPLWTFKTVRFISLASYKRFSKAVLSFSFLFISAESLKNHSKSQKNHKMENPILLDSTWVDLHSKYIIWYVLVQIFCCTYRSMLFYN